MAERLPVQRAASRVATAITRPLVFWAVAAAALGVAASGVARRGSDAVPALLGVMVFATGFTVPSARLGAALRRPERLLLALALQYGPLALLAAALARLPLSPAVSTGILVVGVTPTEVTAGVMVLLAGGDAALGTALMAASLLASTMLTPALLARFATGPVQVDRAALLNELTLSIAAPLIAALLLRWLISGFWARVAAVEAAALFDTPVPAAPRGRSADAVTLAVAIADEILPAVAALAVLCLLFVVAGTARAVLLSRDIVPAVALCLLLNGAGYAAGWALFRTLQAPERAVRAGVFTAGMREFGVAATVAAAVLPAAAAVAGVYGIVILVTAPLLVRFYGSRPG